MMNPLACGMALTLFLQLMQSTNPATNYIGSVVFIGSKNLYSIDYRNIGKSHIGTSPVKIGKLL